MPYVSTSIRNKKNCVLYWSIPSRHMYIPQVDLILPRDNCVPLISACTHRWMNDDTEYMLWISLQMCEVREKSCYLFCVCFFLLLRETQLDSVRVEKHFLSSLFHVVKKEETFYQLQKKINLIFKFDVIQIHSPFLWFEVYFIDLCSDFIFYFYKITREMFEWAEWNSEIEIKPKWNLRKWELTIPLKILILSRS